MRVVEVPSRAALGDEPADLLAALGGPALFRVAGVDRSRCRAVVTLLHGNEPSGLVALHRWLRGGERPAVDVVCVVAAVEAARRPPGFAHRMLPGEPDLNRCFVPPRGELAASILDELRAARCEALVDLHNTTGRTRPYGIGVLLDPVRLGLVSLFAPRYVHMNVRVGALVEALESELPAVVIECGRAGDPAADEIAYQGLRRFVAGQTGVDTIFTVFEATSRVVLKPGAELIPDLDQFNLVQLDAGAPLGPLAGDRIPFEPEELFEVRDGVLVTRCPLALVMMTHDPAVASSDCVGYVARSTRTSEVRAL